MPCHANAMQWQPMTCNDMPCHATPWDVMQRHAMSCHAIPCNTIQCQPTQSHSMSYNTRQCHARPCNAMLCNATPRHATPFNAMQHYTTPWNTIQCHSKYVKLHPKLAYDCSYHVPPYQRNQLSRNMSHCTQNWHIIIDTIHHKTKVTNQLQNMSH